MTESVNNDYTKVTIHLRVETHGVHAAEVLATLRDEEIAGALNEIAAEYISGDLDLDVCATGEATVTEGWDESADAVMALVLRSPDFDDIRSRVSAVNNYEYTGDAEDFAALDPADRAVIEALQRQATNASG